MEEARERLARAIIRGEGPTHLIGSAGTGKSLLLEVLATQFREQMSVVTLIGAQLCTRRALLQMILFELSLPYRGMDEGELRLALIQTLRDQEKTTRPMLVLVDEADALPTRLLQELRILNNLSEQGQPLVRLVLAGNAILEERFADPELEAFNQRISARCYLSPLGREETFGYVRSQVTASGGDVDLLFSPDGLEAIFAVTDGVPRLINQLGDQLIWMAQETGYQPLDGAIVQQAWSELQQLPAPWNHSAIPSTDPSEVLQVKTGVVEFGDLGEMPPLQADATRPDTSTAFTVEGSSGPCQKNDEDLPASIPFDISLAEPTHPLREPGMETIDATEKLLQDLNEIQGEPVANPTKECPAKEKPPEAYNPFEESFATEEVVFDQYASFEAQLLATASQVVNLQDRQFACELECAELNRSTVAISSAGQQDLTTDSQADMKAALDLQGEVREVITLESADTMESSTLHVTAPQMPHETASPTTSIKPTRCQAPQPQPDKAHSALLVQGRQFRQLFSQLESGKGSSIYG